MQDRSSANSMKVLLQRTAGPYIRVNRVGLSKPTASANVSYGSNSVQLPQQRELTLSAEPFVPAVYCREVKLFNG
jgi:hypothetical protein